MRRRLALFAPVEDRCCQRAEPCANCPALAAGQSQHREVIRRAANIRRLGKNGRHKPGTGGQPGNS
ncbi:MAG: hypothetical protein U0792_24985 [Gemmataceae bacterium]